MKQIIKICAALLITATLFLPQQARAQAPGKMSYQAVVRDASNNLVSSTDVGMRIQILQGSEFGAAVYVETQTPTSNANGLVSLEIGAGTVVSGDFTTIDWANGPYFVKTEIDPNGGTNYSITGTSQLLSVPYALYAENAWGFNGNSGTNDSVNFIGTTDDQDIVFKRNNEIAGRIGIENTSIGNGSLANNTTGIYNTSVGVESLRDNTMGEFNTSVGWKSMFANTTGSENTSVGRTSLASNTTGVFNTSVGKSSLYTNTTGVFNTSVGANSMFSNTTGQDNTSIGAQSLDRNTIGNNNTSVGSQSLEFNTTGQNNTSVGKESLESNISGNNNTAIGYVALRYNTIGDFNTAIGFNSLFNVTTGSNNTGVGRSAQVPNATGSNQVRIGNVDVTYAGVQVAWSVTSDSRWKSNISRTTLGLNFINSLNPVSYTRNNDEAQKLEFGFIAQDLQQSLIDFKAENNGIITTDDEGMLSVRYNDLLAPMVKAIQELNAENAELLLSNNELNNRIEKLEGMLNTLLLNEN